jgi:hypothetical protein
MPYEIERCGTLAAHDPHPWGEPVKGADILQYKLHCPGVDDAVTPPVHGRVWTLAEIAGGITYWLTEQQGSYNDSTPGKAARAVIQDLVDQANESFGLHTTPWSAVRG